MKRRSLSHGGMRLGYKRAKGNKALLLRYLISSAIICFLVVFSTNAALLQKWNSQVLMVSSSVLCDVEHNADCRTKHWIRRNTFHNWISVNQFDVLIMVDHRDDCGKLPKTVMCVRHDCWHDSMGLPKVGCLIQDSIRTHPNKVVVFTNDDMSFRGLNDTIVALNDMFDEYVAVGRRTNVPLDGQYTPSLDRMLLEDAPLLDVDTIPLDQMKESDAYELDYFVFKLQSPSVLDAYPDFLLGNWRWDNMMVDYLIQKNITLIDVSKSVTAHHLGKTATSQDSRHGAQYNNNLMKSYLMDTAGAIDDVRLKKHHVIRFGCMDNAEYRTERGDDGLTISVHRLRPPVVPTVIIEELLDEEAPV